MDKYEEYIKYFDEVDRDEQEYINDYDYNVNGWNIRINTFRI